MTIPIGEDFKADVIASHVRDLAKTGIRVYPVAIKLAGVASDSLRLLNKSFTEDSGR